MRNTFILCSILVACISCEHYQQDSYEEYYVVESYLVANDQLPEVLLSTTSPIDEEYNSEDQAISGADIEVHLLHADSSIARVYPYQPEGIGVYGPVSMTASVKEERLYQLHVTTQSGDSITATTFVPGNFDTENELREEYVYQSDQQIEITTSPSYYPGRQTYYLFTVNAVSPDARQLTPFYRDLVQNQGNNIANYYENSSGIINEENYEQNDITLKVPWLSIAFYGRNNVLVNAIDDNMYDFLRTQEAQTGGMSLSPGTIQNINYNVNGGIGIFGSMASDTNRIEIIRSENQE